MSSTSPATDDTELVRRAAEGDETAFAELFRRWSGLVHMHCVRQLGSVEGADDQVAIVFLEAWRRRADIRVVNGKAIAWLLVTATNVCRNATRSRRRYRAALCRMPEPPPEPDHAEAVAESAVGREATTALAEALATLNTKDRHVLSLCLLNDMTYAEAAEVLGMSHAAVRSRLSRARAQLRAHLEKSGFATHQGENSWTS
jgi:RNA polymerase sigma-70 factor (ECF subfamily)